MATTQIMPIHPNMEWGAAQTIKDVIDYVMNPAKTNGGSLVTGYECDPAIAAEDFMFSRDVYQSQTKRNQGENEVLVYHIRQSFLPGEVDVETAERLGYELAMELTGGNHSFIVCTHTDRPHLHNHIVINAVNLDCDGKFRNEIGSYRRVRKNADRISAENNLHVVENPQPSKGTKNRYNKTTKRDVFVALIDKILEASPPPKDFDDFLKQLEKNGCKIKLRGKTISVQPPDAERYFRFRTGEKGLPDGYDIESLTKKIANLQAGLHEDSRNATAPRTEEFTTAPHAGAERVEDFSSVMDDVIQPDESTLADDTPSSENITEPASTPAAEPAQPTVEPATRITHDKKINLLIDIENSIKAQDSPGYERWAKGFNLQQAAETLLFLQSHNLTDMDDLSRTAHQSQTEYDALQRRIDTADSRIKDINTLQRHIGAYRKNRDVYSQYLRSKRNPRFRQDNEKAIATAEEAKAYFNSLGLDKLPTIKELQAEYSVLSQEKNICYQARNEMRRHVFDLQSAKKNAEMLLGIATEPDIGRTKKNSRGDER